MGSIETCIEFSLFSPVLVSNIISRYFESGVVIPRLVYQMGPMGPMNPDWNSNTVSTVSILLGFIIVLLVFIIVYLWVNQNKRQPVEDVAHVEQVSTDVDKVQVVLKLLNDNEKLIVQALLDHGGEMLQKDISYELELTRVQTHRTIQSLLEREIVSSEPHFNTNKISLNPWVRE